jgi:hypothetical protein
LSSLISSLIPSRIGYSRFIFFVSSRL